ncbi:DEAD/DEAH box helicase [Ureibacillus chungkukjangi]|uniref:DEAD/DEAH box helicase n=1 Tax=Ureibacillus chungkukjangi TaxID=1202712 RepID=UPI00384F0520
MFNIFKRKNIPKNKILKLNITTNYEEIKFQFFTEQDGVKTNLTIPLNDIDFRECVKLDGFHAYWAYEFLVDEGYIESQNLLKIEHFYELVNNPDFEEAFTALGINEFLSNVTGIIKINGTPASNPEFDLQLYVDNKNLQQIAEVRLPFVIQGNRRYFVSEEIYKLWQAIVKEDYEDGYEKTAIVRGFALQANIKLDGFLEREKYHLIDNYQIEPQIINDETLQLSIVGEDEKETAHLNSMHIRNSIKHANARERYVTPKKVIEDVQKIKQKSIFTGEEIPMLVQNPEAFFPDLVQPFNIENFSDRVIGFVKIVRPTPTIMNGKRTWFDNETGDVLEVDEEMLRKEILEKPQSKFIHHQKNWVFVDKKLKQSLGLNSEDEQQTNEKYALEIMGNEDEVTYNLAKNKLTMIDEYELPSKMIANLFPHQKEGYNWLCSLYEQGFSGLLADDMGLGKTIQVITFMQRQLEKNKLFPSLVVLPIALIENWVNEIAKFAPELSDKIYIHKGSSRIKDVQNLKNQQLIFTSYDTLKIDQLLLGQIGFECIILDEAQNIKSNSSSRSRAIRAMQGKFRLAMTGTPVENSLEELWTIMDFVEPGALGALSEFKKKFIKNEDYEGLKDCLQKYYLRRTKDEVLKDQLPQKHLLKPIYVNASPLQSQLAAAMMANVRSKTSNLLNVIGSLRVLYAHPNALTEFEIDEEIPPKFDAVIKLLEDIQAKNEKVLIFTEFKKVQALLKRFISEKFQISVPIINGETTNRSDVVRQFNEQQGFGVMLLSPKAAGVGLTITGANHVIHYTRWWNPAVENQATDRAYRIGQQKEVYVYQIITKDSINFPNGTVEEIMHQILTDKSYLAENVIVPFDTSGIQEKVKQAIANQKVSV